jgi:hypothetical protein
MVATGRRRLPRPTGVIVSGRRWRPIGTTRVVTPRGRWRPSRTTRVIAAGRRRSAGVAWVITARRRRLSRSARVVASRRRWLVVMRRRWRLVTFRRRWRRWGRSRWVVAGAAGHRGRAVVDVVIRIERTAHTRRGSLPTARAFDIGGSGGRARGISGVVGACIANARCRIGVVVTDRDREPLRELASGIGGARRRTGRIRRVVGTQVCRQRTTQRCGLDCQRGVVQAADPEREADDYGSYARGPCHDAHRICGFLRIIGGLNKGNHAPDFC